MSTPPKSVLPNKTINFFLDPRSEGCSTRSEEPNAPQLNPFEALLTSGDMALEDTCHNCNSSNCPSPSGFAGPYWMKPALEYLCQNCIDNPLVDSFSNGNGCQDSTNGCYWMKDVFTNCFAPGDPPFIIQCVSRQLTQCQTQSCVDEDGDGYFKESPSCLSGPFDCNDDPNNGGAGQHPGLDENCYDTNRVDENCNNVSNCADSYCRTNNAAQCSAECDKDNDRFYADTAECGGDDCIDDRAVNQFAALYNPDADELCDPQSTADFDCDTAPGCSDSDCSTDPACQGGGGGGGGYFDGGWNSYYSCTNWWWVEYECYPEYIARQSSPFERIYKSEPDITFPLPQFDSESGGVTFRKARYRSDAFSEGTSNESWVCYETNSTYAGCW